MKLYFKKEDSIHKIIKTIDKIVTNKDIVIDIHQDNVFFENLFWGKLLVEKIQNKGINVKFISKTKLTSIYFQKIGVDILQENIFSVRKLGQLFLDFFLKARNLHYSIFSKRDFFSYFIISVEIAVVLYVFYFINSIITPSAEVFLKPSYIVDEIVYNYRFFPNGEKDKYVSARFLSCPYYTGILNFEYNTLIEVENIKYSQTPSKGKVKIYNNLNKEYSLVPNTTFVTQDGLIFKSKNWFRIPPYYESEYIEVELEADIKDESGKIIGERGNILSGTNLLIKKLPDSFNKKEIYAVASNDFIGGTKSGGGTITENDINILTGKLLNFVTNSRKNLVLDKVKDEDIIVLPFIDTINVNSHSFSLSGNIGDDVELFNGKIKADISYYYIKWSEFSKTIGNYIFDRKSEVLDLLKIDKNSLLFFELQRDGQVIILPTKIDVIWGYDFEKDVNGLLDEIKNKILGLSKSEAEKLILDSSEIDVAIVKINPVWYNVVPLLKSRIEIIINKN